MKNLVRTFILATLATCITSYTACEQATVSASTNSTIVAAQPTLQTNSSSTGTQHDETTMTTKSATTTYLIAGGITVVAVFGIIMAMRYFMSRNHELPFLAVEDPAAPLALSQVTVPEVVV